MMKTRQALGLAVALYGVVTHPPLQAQSDVTQPGDPVIASSTNSPGSETAPNAIDNQPTKYLNFDTVGTDPVPSGFIVSPSVGLTLVNGLTIQSANDAVERDPKHIRLEGSNDEEPLWDGGTWEILYENDDVQPWTELFAGDDRFQTQMFSFENNRPFAHYRLTVVSVQGSAANSTQYAEVELLGSVLPGDVTQPGDTLVSSSTNSPGSETGPNAIDNQPTKYLNFDTVGTDPVPSGFVVTPAVGRTVLIGMTIQSANDAVERDPKWVRLEGSNDEAPTWDSGNWDVIYENNEVEPWVDLFPGDDRFQTQTFIFDNSRPYTHYRWTVLEVQGSAANSMQVAEVELLGRSAPVDVTQPGDPLMASSTNSPGSETGPNAIDNQPTKYLNFDTVGTDPVPSGFVVSPSVGATTIVGLSMQSANDAVERDPKWVRLEGSNDEAPTWDSGNWEIIYENNEIEPWTVLFAGNDRFQTQEFFFPNGTAYLHYRWTVLEVQGSAANSMQIAEVELLAFSESADCEKADFVTQPVDTPVLRGVGASATFFTKVNGPWPVQWYKNGEAIPGAVQTRYTTDPITEDNQSDVYTVQIVGCDSSEEVSAYLLDPQDRPESIGISFVGSGANGAPTSADPTGIGGSQLQGYWNNLPPAGAGVAAGSQGSLLNSRNETTEVAVEWATANSWGAGTGTDNTDARILNGLVEGGISEEEPATITFSNVPEGSHSLLIYSVARPLEFPVVTYHQVESDQRITMVQENADQFNPNPVFRQVTVDDPDDTLGNLARFDNVRPVDGTVTLNFWDSGGEPVTDSRDSTINAVQLVLNALFDPPLDGPDEDGDGLPDIWETNFFGDISRDGSGDFDEDGLIDSEELANKVDPSNADTDGDGLEDGPEVNTHGSNPARIDTDGDTLNDFDEVTIWMTDPANSDSDGDGVVDSVEVNPEFATDPNDADSVPDVIVATQSGAWMDPATWGGTAPVAGQKYVALTGIASQLTTTAGAFAGDSLTMIGSTLVLAHNGTADVNLILSNATVRAEASNTLEGTLTFGGDSRVIVGGNQLAINAKLQGSDGATFMGGTPAEPNGDIMLGGPASTLTGDIDILGTQVSLLSANVLAGAGEGDVLLWGGGLAFGAPTKFCGNLSIRGGDFVLAFAGDFEVRDLIGFTDDGTEQFRLQAVLGNTTLPSESLVIDVGFSDDQVTGSGNLTLNDALECSPPGCEDPEADTDGDGLMDCDETLVYGTDPNLPDTDGDGVDDATEIADGTNAKAADTDEDGLNDLEEKNLGTNPNNSDTDGDFFGDAEEVELGSDPNDANSRPPAFLVEMAQYTTGATDIDGWEARTDQPTRTSMTGNHLVIDFADNSDANFMPSPPFPLFGVAGDENNFFLRATGQFEVTEAGMRTFGVNSDDGFRVRIDGEIAGEFAAPRGNADTFFTVDLAAGVHDIELTYYENGGGAQVELFMANQLGEFTAFDPNVFELLRAAGGGAPPVGDGFVFDPSFAIPAGTSYDVEYSIDLQEPWEIIATDQTGVYIDTDPTRAGRLQGYYRGVTNE